MQENKKTTHHKEGTTVISHRIPDDLLKWLDENKGFLNRSSFINTIIQEKKTTQEKKEQK